ARAGLGRIGVEEVAALVLHKEQVERQQVDDVGRQLGQAHAFGVGLPVGLGVVGHALEHAAGGGQLKVKLGEDVLLDGG
nr:hypothetical protein [Tanacetum cinerariifolium]